MTFKPVCLMNLIILVSMSAIAQQQTNADNHTFRVTLQKRAPAKTGDSQDTITRDVQQWDPSQTAIIICDMWDKHWCKDATTRVNELAPRINGVISAARSEGVLIVHAPSDCMDYYKDYPGRNLALKYRNPGFNRIMNEIGSEKLPSETNVKWPIDDSDEGCTSLTGNGSVGVWTKENGQIDIRDSDVISDAGDEIAGVFAATGIRNVILMGVHTNMCVIGRSFGMRNMVRLGMNVVLMRDMTDAMYDSRSWPYVSHFSGVNLMIQYIEKYICPSILSSDFTHETAFGFSGEIK
ncbi:MAG: hypothetical protein ABIY90_02805 [Puia sp.]